MLSTGRANLLEAQGSVRRSHLELSRRLGGSLQGWEQGATHGPTTVRVPTASVDGFDAAIKTNLLDDLGTFEAAEADFDAKLFVQASDPTEPPWAAFLQDGFPASQFVSSASMSAALLVRIRYFGADRYFAFAFGTGGRFLLRPEVYEPRAGLRVALNLMYEDAPGGAASELPPQRIRQVDSRTVSDNTLHTRRQANRRTTFETFEMTPSATSSRGSPASRATGRTGVVASPEPTR